MRNRFSKTLSLLLSVMMIISCFSVFTFAEDASTITVVNPEIPYGEKTVSVTWTGTASWVALYTAEQYELIEADPTNQDPRTKYLCWAYVSDAEGGVLTLPTNTTADDRFSKTSIDIREDLPVGNYVAVLYSDSGYTQGAYATFEVVSEEPEGFVVYLDPTAETNGDGTKESPVTSFNNAIAVVNAANVTEATVAVSNVNTVGSLATVVCSKAHTATITWTTWDSQGTGAKAQVIYDNVIDNAGANGYISGPSEFKNIIIVDPTDTNNKNLTLEGHDCVIHSDVLFYHDPGLNRAFAKDTSVHVVMAANRMAKGKPGDGSFLHIYNAGASSGQVDGVYVSSYADTATHDNFIHFTGNVALFVEGGTLGSVYVDDTNGSKIDTITTYPDERATFEKNFSLVLNDSAVVTTFSTNHYSVLPKIKGALQIVVNNGSSIGSITDDAIDADGNPADVYYLYSKSSDINLGVDNDGAAGEFTVSGGNYAYAASLDGLTYYYGNETLTLPEAGTYNVYAAASVDDIIAAIDTQPSKEGASFDKWVDNGDGTIVPSYREYMTKDYYVIYGGTGDGRTVDTPAPSVAAAVKSVNEDLVKGDTARINIMDYVNEEDDSQSWYNYAGGSDTAYIGRFIEDGATSLTTHTQPHHMTPWVIGTPYTTSNFPNHEATLLVTSYDFENTNEVTHLAYTPTLGQNEDLYLFGPVIFENISLVQMRSSNRGISAQGYDLTFGEGTLLQHVKTRDEVYAADFYTSMKVCFHNNMKLVNSNHNVSLGSIYNYKKSLDGGTVRFESGSYGVSKAGSRGIGIPSIKSGVYTFSGREALYIDNAGINSYIYWGSMQPNSTDYFNGGLAIVVNNSGTLESSRWMSSGAANYANVVINGGYQVICNNGKTFPKYLDNVTVNGGEWYMNSADTSGNMLDLTDTAGTFKVIGGMIAVATNEDGEVFASNDGILTVDAGTYTVNYVSEANLVPVYLDGELESELVSGSNFVFPELDDTAFKLFGGWTDGTNSYAGGDVYTLSDETELSFTSVWNDYEDTVVVYVSETGSDSNNGQTPATAYASLNTAIKAIKNNAALSKKIAVIGTVSFAASLEAHDTMISIVGDGDGAVLTRSTSPSINGPTTFENVDMHFTAKNCFLNTGNYELVIGENVTSSSASSDISANFNSHVGVENNNTTQSKVTIGSKMAIVYLGSYYNKGDYTVDGADVVINGATVSNLNPRADGFTSTTAMTGATFIGDINITNNGGEVTNFANTGTYATKAFNASINIINNEGIFTSIGSYTVGDSFRIVNNSGTISKVDSITATNGVVEIVNNGGTLNLAGTNSALGTWILNAEESDSKLSLTETAGTYNVSGTLTALAVTSDGKQYISQDGVLTVPAGTYTVTFHDKVEYTNDGSTVVFYLDTTLDTSTLSYSEPEGKFFLYWRYEDGSAITGTSFAAGDKLVAVYADFDGETMKFYNDATVDMTAVEAAEKEGKFFIGWVDENGTGVTDFNFTNGDVLTAQYIDFAVEEDFTVLGAQIRKDQEIADKSQALRFVTYMSKGLDEKLSVDADDYGTVILPSLIVGREELVLGGTYTYDSETYEAQDVPAEVLFEETADYRKYTVAVTDLADLDYSRMFTVRGYIRYTDLNGADRVLYTDYYATNTVNIAEAASNDTANSEEDIAYYKNLVDAYKSAKTAEYAAMTKKNIVGTSADEKTWIYQLVEDGVMVREVTIDTGSGKDPILVAQVSDTHFNYVNDRDFEEAYPELLSTYEYRTWNANGSSVPNAVNSLEYASIADQIVVTGDILDYLSWGAIELTQKYIWETYPTVMACLGNHEPVRRCQGKVSESTTLAERYEVLKEVWINDVYYSSKVLDERLMLIQLDNSQNKFWDSQVPLFEADLATAREKGYKVLVFYHIPICGNNAEQGTELAAIRRNDAYTINMYDGEVAGSVAADVYNSISAGTEVTGATAQIYKLMITNADIIKGTFCGHFHSDFYTEIIAQKPVLDENGDFTYDDDGKVVYTETEEDGSQVVIPQYVLTGSPYDKGHVLMINFR